MRSYTTLGTGKSTKVLAVPQYGSEPARTVTTAPAADATRLARLLQRTDRELAAALFQPALELDGKPFEARRHLLSVFDTTAAGTQPGSVSPAWRTAEAMVADLARAVTQLPTPVVTAVRAELAEHLYGFDGVLVPARATTPGSGRHKRACLDLVISAPLHWMGESFWDELAGDFADLGLWDDDTTFPLGGRLVVSTEFYTLVSELHGSEPTADTPFACTMRELRSMVDEGEEVELSVRLDHFLAFVRQHHPGRLAAIEAKIRA